MLFTLIFLFSVNKTKCFDGGFVINRAAGTGLFDDALRGVTSLTIAARLMFMIPTSLSIKDRNLLLSESS